MNRSLLLVAVLLLVAAAQPSPPLTAGEAFRVTFDHAPSYFQLNTATPPAWVPCSPPSASCLSDTQNYQLRIDGTVVQTLPFAVPPPTFTIAAGVDAGTHAIVVEAVGSSGVLSVPVSLPVGAGQVPAPRAQAAPTVARGTVILPGAGLTGEYYTGIAFGALVLTRVDPQVDFDWLLGSPGAPLPIDNFSVRWTGFVTAPTSGNYTFSTTTDDGVRLWIGGVLVVDSWIDQAPTTRTSAPVAMTSGLPVAVRLEFYERDGGATVRLQWTPPGGTRVAIPTSALTWTP